jgi:hypothetical protein
MSSCALSMSVRRGIVFGRTTVIPTLAASISNNLLAYRVKRIIGTFGKIFLNADDATKPLMPGIDKSIVIKSGLICWASSMASIPFAASPHVLKPSDRNAVASNFRIGALSSTTKTVLPIPRLRGVTLNFQRALFQRALRTWPCLEHLIANPTVNQAFRVDCAACCECIRVPYEIQMSSETDLTQKHPAARRRVVGPYY